MSNRVASGALVLITLLTAGSGWPSNSVVTVTNENAIPLSDRLVTRGVWIKNKECKGIENVKVTVDYVSHPRPPVFVSDGQGKAEVKVQSGFMALRINVRGEVGIRMDIAAREVEWPCEIVLPTRKTKF